MKELSGPISDRLREQFPADAKEWTPRRPGDPLPLGTRVADKVRRVLGVGYTS